VTLEVESREQRIAEDGRVLDEFVVNVGPSHPSTHGVLRVIVTLDGDVVTKAVPVIRYLNRGYGKMAKN